MDKSEAWDRAAELELGAPGGLREWSWVDLSQWDEVGVVSAFHPAGAGRRPAPTASVPGRPTCRRTAGLGAAESAERARFNQARVIAHDDDPRDATASRSRKALKASAGQFTRAG